ncbi:MAG: hypothetical protein ACFFG0_51190 [Candidatus Thorarchaeota archaeon]
MFQSKIAEGLLEAICKISIPIKPETSTSHAAGTSPSLNILITAQGTIPTLKSITFISHVY